MPDGDVLLLSLVVDGHIRGLVDFSQLQNQHLEHRERRTRGEREVNRRVGTSLR